MLTHFRNITNLNERFAYNLIGKLRQFLMLFFNRFLNFQENKVRKNIQNRIKSIKNDLSEILPKVTTSSMLNVLNENEQKVIIEAADQILEHNFEIFSTSIHFENKIDWHLDFKSGFRWPKGTLYSRYNQVDVKTNADVKFPREFSRCHHFLTLGQAYILTNDEKYCQAFITQIYDWISENPYKKSINWGCSMDIAIRASNWIYGLRMFSDSELIDDRFLEEIFTSLFLHGRFIYENPEKNRVYNHNHYLSDLAGQILIGLLFYKQNFSESRLWTDNGIYELFREIRVQILPSGFTYERTLNYHRLVTELISYTVILLKNNNFEIPQDISYRVQKMYEVILEYSFQDGTAPIVGDQDSGRFLPFYKHPIDFQKYLMNVGAAFFSVGTFKEASCKNNLDVLFLMGQEGLHNIEKTKSESNLVTSKAFSDAGFYTLRNNKIYTFVNNSGLSHYNEVKGGTHTHSDLLSFVYEFDGVPFLVDPGTYVYSSNPTERMKFRSTAMHNTLTVNDFSQNDLIEKNLWSIKRDAIPNEIMWNDNINKVSFEGSHSGYERLEQPVKHNRRFELDKKTNELRILDKIIGEGEHQIKIHFHFDFDVEVGIIGNVVHGKKNGKKIQLSFESLNEFSLHQKEEFISKSYNHKVSAPYVHLNVSFQDGGEIITHIQSEN